MDIHNLRKHFYRKTESSKVIKIIYYFLHQLRIKFYRFYSNEVYAKQMYRREVGKTLNLNNPATFDEKMWWLKFNYHNPLMTQCADKFKVREYVKNCGYEDILNKMYLGGVTDPNLINYEALPSVFYIKTNHGCGGNICVNKKYGYDKKHISKMLENSMKNNYFYESREWPYKDIKPCIIIEEFIDSGNKPLLDYRFLCFSGKFKYLFVDYDTADKSGHHKIGAKRNVYNRDYELLPYRVSRDNFNNTIAPKPLNYEKMIEIAETLAKPFPFVRVDLYNIDGKIIFGEMTFFHAGALNKIEPHEFDLELGKLININDLSDKL